MSQAQGRSKQAIRGAKAQVRGGKKSAKRPPAKSTSDVPILALVVGGILAALFIGLIIYGAINNQKATIPVVHAASGDIPCDHLEQTQIHYHVAIQIISGGTVHPIPGGIGIQGSESAPTCYYWLHVHSANKNVIHIESPADRVFTLGDFFRVWDAWSKAKGGPAEPLDSKHVSTLTLDSNQTLVVYVDYGDGKGTQLYDGDPNKIVLTKTHEVITIEITPPQITPKDPTFPSFTFPQGL
jgi:hypothetical protein